MGVISKKLASRFRKARRQLGELRRQAAADFAQVPKDVKGVAALVRSGHDPLHAAYVAAQNFTSFFAEAVSPFPEFDPYCQVVGPAQDEYLPSRPPLSPLTMSYFTTWAFFDVRFGPDGETLGTCLLDVAVALRPPGSVSALHVNYGLRERAAELEATAALAKPGAGVMLPAPADVGDPSSVAALFGRIEDSFPRLDLL